ncbi:MAG: membrane protein insertase YidC [Chitinophagales bacterium]
MDKNTITGIVLIILIWVAMSVYNSKQQDKFDATQKLEQKSNKKDTSVANLPNIDSVQKNVVDSSVGNKLDLAEYGVFGAAANGTEKEIVVENEDCIFTFSNKGGVLTKIELKKFKTYDHKPLILFNQTPEDFNFTFVVNSAKRPIQTSQLFFTANNESKVIKGDETYQLDYTISDNSGKLYSQTYTISGKGYVVDFVADAKGLSKEIPQSANVIPLAWTQEIQSHELNHKEEKMSSGVYYQDIDKNVDDIGLMKDKDEKIEKAINWVSLSQKFFNTTLIAKNQPFLANSTVKTIAGTVDSSALVKKLFVELKIPFNKETNYQFDGKFYAGPSSFKELKKVESGLQQIIPVGGSILGLVNKFLVIPIFNFLHKFIANYGIIILILTLIIKLITLPFTYKSQLSMIKMRVLKPEMDALKEKYGKDQATFGAKQMELYQQTGVSPFGGCIPMLLQWPFLIAMYRFFPSAIELRQEKFLWANDLSTYDAVINLPFNIPILGSHLSLFAILGVVTSFGMTLYTMKMQPQQASGGGEFAEAMQKQMKVMQYFFPFMILFFFNSSSAALSYYFFLYNGFSLLQQWIMSKFFIDENAIRAQIEHNKKNPKKKSNFQTRMEEMMKQQQALKEQQKKK